MERKNIVASILLIALIISGIGNIVLIIDMSPPPIEEPPDFIIGTSSGHHTLELVDSWDKASNDVLYQVVETLFSYDLYDLDLPRINLLAHSYWWKNSTTLQIQLREGVLFHDGTPFNSEAAKWNLDRLQYLTNATGTNTGEVAHTQVLWMFPDGVTPIMDTIIAVENYNITIKLNGPYGPFLNTLAYINAGMISPTAHASHATSFIPLTTGDVIGTGPFIYDYFTPNEGVYLSRWEGYWKNLANFKRIKFATIPDSDRNNAMLNKEIDYLIGLDTSFIPSFENDSSITVKRFTDDTGMPSLSYRYLGFNNTVFNVTWRKAISYAINYSYVIDHLCFNQVLRAISPISPAFSTAYNESATVATNNITKAREIMVSMGFGDLEWSDDQWIAVADGPSAFQDIFIDRRYWGRSSFADDLYSALYDSLKYIGITISSATWAWDDPYPFVSDLFLGRWASDYYDPFIMFDPLLNPNSSSNIGQIDDPYLNEKLNLALNTTDDAARNNIYKDIQWYMSEVGYFHAYLYHPKITYVHSADLYGVPYNAMERFTAYGIRRA